MFASKALLLLSVLASDGLGLATPIPPSAPSITWSTCPEVSAPNLDCGQIEVPLSFDHSSNTETITLSMARLKANGTSRLGSLLYNPGGPGVPGAQSIIAVSQGAYLFSADLLEHYDIIAIDPRGTASSQAVACDPELWNPRVNFRPENESEFEAMVAHNKAFGDSCRAKTGSLIDHLDTVHVAKDFELVRQALGEEKLNYLGQSYGTHIGTTYAELFPDKIGRFVLDGVTDHTVSEVGFATDAGVTLEVTLDKFFEWCNATEDCALHGLDAAGVWDDLLAQAPIPAPGCIETGACRPDVTGEEIVFAVKTALHSFDANPLFGPGWPAVSAAIGQAAQGNATLLSFSVATSETDGWFSTIAIACLDWTRNANTSTEFLQRQQMRSTLAPNILGFPAVSMLQGACTGWPAQVTNPNHDLNQAKVSQAPPILLLQSLWDPATSVEWANNIKAQLPGSVLLVRNGVGHSSYQLGGEGARAVDKYLIEEVMPEDGLTVAT